MTPVNDEEFERALREFLPGARSPRAARVRHWSSLEFASAATGNPPPGFEDHLKTCARCVEILVMVLAPRDDQLADASARSDLILYASAEQETPEIPEGWRRFGVSIDPVSLDGRGEIGVLSFDDEFVRAVGSSPSGRLIAGPGSMMITISGVTVVDAERTRLSLGGDSPRRKLIEDAELEVFEAEFPWAELGLPSKIFWFLRLA